jgi:hypothetical protein
VLRGNHRGVCCKQISSCTAAPIALLSAWCVCWHMSPPDRAMPLASPQSKTARLRAATRRATSAAWASVAASSGGSPDAAALAPTSACASASAPDADAGDLPPLAPAAAPPASAGARGSTAAHAACNSAGASSPNTSCSAFVSPAAVAGQLSGMHTCCIAKLMICCIRIQQPHGSQRRQHRVQCTRDHLHLQQPLRQP